MYLLSVWDLLQAWEHSCCPVEQRENVWPCQNAEIMIHQPSGGARGQATEIQIVADQILKTRHRLNTILAANTGQPLEKIALDTERDNYMTAEEAKAYGLIDDVITKR